MNQKQIGIMLLIAGIILAGLTFAVKIRDDIAIKKIIATTGSCYLADGTCLHEDRDYTLYTIGWIISGVMILFAVYLVFFDKTQQVLAEHQQKVSTALKEAKEADKNKDEFSAFLSAFNDDEKKLLKLINENEGITQSTLRYKADMSKTAISLLVSSLVERKIVSRKVKGKTYELYLVKKF